MAADVPKVGASRLRMLGAPATRTRQPRFPHRSATGWFSYILKDPAREGTLLRVRFRPASGRGHILRLTGADLAEPLLPHAACPEVQEFPVTAGMRGSVGGGQALEFSVHALPGLRTGDLLSVELVKGR